LNLDYIITDEPDFIFYSVYDNLHINYDCVKIFISGEAIAPDFNYCDYAIGYDYIVFDDRYLRWPSYLNQIEYTSKEFISNVKASKNLFEREFCSFVYSNSNDYSERSRFYHLLSEYRLVNSGGRFLNDTGQAVISKIDFDKTHKFSICFENCVYPGYTSEKIIDGFRAKTIPIYYGNRLITEEFDSISFINVHDYSTFEEVVKRIIEVDNDPKEYIRILNSNKLLDYNRDGLLNFLENIFKVVGPKKRVPVNYWTRRNFINVKIISIILNVTIFRKLINVAIGKSSRRV
jgi:hypothetical protein